MDSLREKIAGIVQEHDPSGPGLGDTAEEIADRILAIPEIAEALKLQDRYFLRDGAVVERLGSRNA